MILATKLQDKNSWNRFRLIPVADLSLTNVLQLRSHSGDCRITLEAVRAEREEPHLPPPTPRMDPEVLIHPTKLLR